MGNELSVVAQNYGFKAAHPLTRLARFAERTIVRHADVVIAHFPAITASVGRWAPGTPVEVVPNIAFEPPPSADLAAELRRRWAPDGSLLLVYTGTLEAYQGLENLVDAMADPGVRRRNVHLAIAGGQGEQVDALRSRAERLGLGSVTLAGLIPSDRVTSALAAADVLVSPRLHGTNTPLKLFSYLRSGRPILATRLESHTQILDDGTALLVGTDAADLAAGIVRLADDEALRARLAAAGRLLGEYYSPRAFVAGVQAAYGHVEHRQGSAHPALATAAAKVTGRGCVDLSTPVNAQGAQP
jgi:glycosyltransferase involved in cell wall biosynthesis